MPAKGLSGRRCDAFQDGSDRRGGPDAARPLIESDSRAAVPAATALVFDVSPRTVMADLRRLMRRPIGRHLHARVDEIGENLFRHVLHKLPPTSPVFSMMAVSEDAIDEPIRSKADLYSPSIAWVRRVRRCHLLLVRLGRRLRCAASGPCGIARSPGPQIPIKVV